YDEKWLKTQKVVEEFQVRGGTTVYDTIVFTHYGPVVYDRNYDVSTEQLNLAMRWTAHDASDYQTFIQLNQAYNYDAYSQALSKYVGPPQNIAFASAAGDIAIRISGKFPVKWEEQGKFIMDGRDSRQEWQEMMPWEHTYKVLNPPQGFVSSANQHPGDGTYPYYDYDYNFEYYRNRRINDRLSVMTNITEEDMMALQNDNFNYIASELLPAMLDSLQFDSTRLSTPKGRMYTTLSNWDFFNEPDLTAPSLFELWQDSLYNLVWDEFEGQEISLIRPNRYNTTYILLNKPDFGFIDRQETPSVETVGDLFRLAFDQAYDGIEQWKERNGDDHSWYKFKNTSILHILQIKPFSREQVRIGGNHNIVNAASGRHGPSWRFVVKLDSTGTQGWGVYPGSQSGNPGNPTYGQMIDPWSSGKYYELLFAPSISEDNESIVHNLRLIP
ncbi:MAG: penicillin acylase family protein, partial [Bacteroidota bacterium]